MSRGELAQGRRAGNMDCGGKRSATPLSVACRHRANQSAVALRLPARSGAGRERREVSRRLNDEREFTGEGKAGCEKNRAELAQCRSQIHCYARECAGNPFENHRIY